MTTSRVVLLLVVVTAACESGSGRSPSAAGVPTSATAAPAPSTTPTEPAVTAPSGQDSAAPTGQRFDVIVDLAVRWEPESGLSPAAAAAQAARIEAVQDELVRALGSHGSLMRRLSATAQVALSVDAEGRALLSRSTLVAAVRDDVPRPPAGRG